MIYGFVFELLVAQKLTTNWTGRVQCSVPACFSGTKAIYLKLLWFVALDDLSILDSWTV